MIDSGLRYLETFFDSWSNESAYLLGLFASDGSMYKNMRGSSYIAFTSTDLELLEIFKSILRLSNTIEIYERPGNFKTSYTLQIGSKLLYSRFLALGFTPAKSKNLVFPLIPDPLLGHFLRGYFDGDGSIYHKKLARKGRNGFINYLLLNFRCGSKVFLETLQAKLITILRVGSGSLYFHSGAYSLAYSGRDVVKLYDFLYPTPTLPHLKRKRVSFEKGIESILRP